MTYTAAAILGRRRKAKLYMAAAATLIFGLLQPVCQGFKLSCGILGTIDPVEVGLRTDQDCKDQVLAQQVCTLAFLP